VSSVGAYLAMGGYAVYVWPAYALSMAALGGVGLCSWRRYRGSVRRLEQLQRQLGARR
jgi:heme exporter protein D